MTTKTVLTDEQIVYFYRQYQETHGISFADIVRAVEAAVLASPKVVRMHRNTLLYVLGKLNSNPYSLTKSECIAVVREMFNEADAAIRGQS